MKIVLLVMKQNANADEKVRIEFNEFFALADERANRNVDSRSYHVPFGFSEALTRPQRNDKKHLPMLDDDNVRRRFQTRLFIFMKLFTSLCPFFHLSFDSSWFF